MVKKFLTSNLIALSIIFSYTLFEAPKDFKFYFHSLEDFNFIIEELDFK